MEGRAGWERATSAHRAEARERGIDLSAAPCEDLPEVDVDPDRIAQVLHNLLSNALRVTPKRGRIVLSARAKEAVVTVSVSDSGPGIPPDDLERIFERFYRTDKSRHRHKGGSGLGLAIARSVVEAHGGRIWAQSPPGQGAMISFSLPIR